MRAQAHAPPTPIRPLGHTPTPVRAHRVLYIAYIQKSAMKEWVSTAALVISHLQTLAILGNLRLSWPPAVEATTDILSLSLALASFLRPECFVDSSRAFVILSTAQVGTPDHP